MTERRGAALPLALVTVSVLTILAYSMIDRGVRLERAGRRAVLREEARAARSGILGLRVALLSQRDEFLSAPPGTGGMGDPTGTPESTLRWRRPHAMVASLDLPLSSETPPNSALPGDRVVVWMHPPRWPLYWDPVEGLRGTATDSTWKSRVAQLPHHFSPPAGWGDGVSRWSRVLVSPGGAPSRFQHAGVLIVDGPLTLTGRWEVTGLLVLLGPITVAGGSLLVRGGMVADGPVPLPVPGAVELISDRLAVERALALLGRPTRAPFHLWQATD